MMSLNVPHRRQSGLKDQPSQDKENVPPSFGHEQIRKQKRIDRGNNVNTKGKWTNETLEEVVDAIEMGQLY